MLPKLDKKSREFNTTGIGHLLFDYVREKVFDPKNLKITCIHDEGDVKLYFIEFWVDSVVGKIGGYRLYTYYINTNYNWDWQYFTDVHANSKSAEIW